MNHKINLFYRDLKQIVLELYGTHLTYLVHELLKTKPKGMRVSDIGRELVGVYSNKREKIRLKERIRGALKKLEDKEMVERKKISPPHQIPFHVFYLIKKEDERT